ncbi:hypothetical protein HN51_054602 [Arachis hypogaea]
MGQRVTKLMAVILAIIMVVALASEVEGGRKLKGDKGIMKKDDENMDQPQNFVGGMGAILPSPNGYTFTGVGFGPNGFCTFPGGCTPTTLPTITNPPPAFRSPSKHVFPSPNATVLEQLSNIDCIVYSMVLLGIGEIISSRSCLKEFRLDKIAFNLQGEHLFLFWKKQAIKNSVSGNSFTIEASWCQIDIFILILYVISILVPRNSSVPVDVDRLNAQGIFDVIVVDSLRDFKVGIIYNPKLLIRALADLIDRYMKSKGKELIDAR